MPPRPRIWSRTRKKMAAKNLDMIACNDVLANGAGFASDTNTLMIMTKGGSEVEISGTKEDVADTLLDAIIKKKNRDNGNSICRGPGTVVD